MPLLTPPSKIFIAACVLVSGICWYFSFSLSGSFWYLQWVAPLPVSYIIFRVKAGPAFWLAFVAYLTGRLSWLPYLLSVIPAFLAIAFTVLLPLVFAALIALSRKIVIKYQHWAAAFSFPILFTSFEYLSFLFSRDGTIASIAYPQSNFLPVVQVASVTGLQGITFLLSFIPFAIAVMLYLRGMQKNIKPLAITAIAVAAVVMIFGTVRLADNASDKQNTITVGMAVADEHIYTYSIEPNTAKEMQIAQSYLSDVPALAAQQAKTILLPEKAVIVNDSTAPVVQQMFARAATANHVHIIVGVTKIIKQGVYENRVWAFNESGALVADYQKVNLFEGEAAEGFVPGKTISTFTKDNTLQGTAICKDLDFQQYINQYAKAGIAAMYVPAWDFVWDGWLHSRMAIMRSAEGGYAMARNSREGRLTVNDYRGKVLFEASCENKQHTTLIAQLPLGSHATFYSKTGDWFSVINLIGAAVGIVFLVRRRRVKVVEAEVGVA